MSILRASVWNSAVVAVRLASALALNKILALLVGPAGYAVIGQFQNALSMITSFSSGALQSGIVKYTATYGDDEKRQARLTATATGLVSGLSLAAAVMLVILYRPLGQLFFKSQAYAPAFLFLAGSLVFVNLNGLVLSVLNGRKDFRGYAISSIAANVASLVLTGVLTWRFGLAGSLVGLSVGPALALAFSLWQAWRQPWFRMTAYVGALDALELKQLGKFALMGLTTAITTPLSQLLIRSHLVARFGLESAGLWDALSKMSVLFLGLFTTTMSLYYLPRIAEIRGWSELKREIARIYLLVLPPMAATALFIYLLRSLVVQLLFSHRFEGMEVLFKWQLAGDLFKAASWIVAFLMIGKKLTRLYIVTEIAFTGLLYVLTVLATQAFGFQGVSIAYLATYILYGLTLYVLILSTPGRRAALFA